MEWDNRHLAVVLTRTLVSLLLAVALIRILVNQPQGVVVFLEIYLARDLRVLLLLLLASIPILVNQPQGAVVFLEIYLAQDPTSQVRRE